MIIGEKMRSGGPSAVAVLRATIGCAHIGQSECEVIIADNTTLEFLGFNYDIVLRHEQSHCNGWPADHPGAETA